MLTSPLRRVGDEENTSNYEALRALVDDIRALPGSEAFPPWDFSGPAMTIPE